MHLSRDLWSPRYPQLEEGQRGSNCGARADPSLPRLEGTTSQDILGDPGTPPLLSVCLSSLACPSGQESDSARAQQVPSACGGRALLPQITRKWGESLAVPALAWLPGVCWEDSRSVQSA